MTTRFKLLCTLVASLLLSVSPTVQAAGDSTFFDSYNISAYTMTDGLTNNHIDDVFRDSKGFMWIAYMGGGLSRFDGYDFVNFSDVGMSESHIKSKFVRSITEDSHHRLWIGGDCGIDVIELTTMKVVTDRLESSPLSGILDTPADNLITDSTGAVWISGSNHLHRITFGPDGDVAALQSVAVAQMFHSGMEVRDVESNGSVWGGVGGTVYRFRPAHDGSITSRPVAPSLTNLRDVEYMSDFLYKDGEVWISTNRGLYRYDLNTAQTKHYESVPGREGSLSQNFLTSLAVTESKQLLVASLKGVNVYNPITDSFELAGNVTHTLNNEFINKIAVDGLKIYVATEGGGLSVLTPRALHINTYRHDDANPGSLSPNPVNAIVRGHDGTLYVGTVEGGLNIMSQGSNEFKHITAADRRISHNSVSALALDNDGHLWVGTWGGGIDVLTATPPYAGVLRLNHHTVPDLAFIGSLTYDSINNGMMIGSNRGLLYYDLSTGKLGQALTPGADFDPYGFIGSIISTDGHLWLGSARGLTVIDLTRRHDDGTFPYEFYRQRLDNPTGATVEKPTSFSQPNDSVMWVGTNGNGLYCGVRDPLTGIYRYTNYTTDNGLASNIIRGLVADNDNTLWVATINGLSSLHVPTGRITNYTTNDGLPDNQFYWNSTLRDVNGDLLLGTVDGIVVIHPAGNTSHPPVVPSVVFTKLFIGNRSVSGADSKIAGSDVAYADHITLHESDKSILVEFSALDYGRRDNVTYSYRLKGFDREWITVNSDRRWANYTNLSPGKYVLQVKYSPYGPGAAEVVTELPVTVRPYFYKSGWFMLLAIILIIGVIALLYRYRVSRLKQQRAMLQAAVASGTSEIERQKNLAEQRANELAQRNEELTARNIEITQQKAQLTEMNNRVSKMTMDRIAFFTNITHEFRTPITLIIGPIERALKLSTNPKVIEQLNFVERNSKYLLSLVNQLMDFRKAESGKFDISYTRGDIRHFVDDTVTPFIPAASDRNISVNCLFRLHGGTEMTFDSDALRKLVTNLLTNAIKYTPDNGTVTLYIAMLPPSPAADGNPRLFISVRDNGCGIPEQDIDNIFDRYFQSEQGLKYPLPGAGDSGLGLYICRRIVELHHGTITVHNNKLAGCTFRVILPMPDSRNNTDNEIETKVADHNSDTALTADTRVDTVILIVEDNDDMRQYVSSILRDDYTLLQAANGEEALRILADTRVDLIISDVMMPVMDGIELSRRVKENFATSHIPFLILTAKTNSDSRLDSYRIGVDDYLLKPFDEKMLLARIDGILRNRRRLQQNFNNDMDTEVLDIATESRDKKFVDQVMETVRSNYKNSYFEVGDFADALGISRSLLNKKLQSLLGQSAGQLVRNYRLNMARELILKNRTTRAMNISEIAYEVGFNDSKYFTRCFTKQFNITPSALLNNP